MKNGLVIKSEVDISVIGCSKLRLWFFEVVVKEVEASEKIQLDGKSQGQMERTALLAFLEMK